MKRPGACTTEQIMSVLQEVRGYKASVFIAYQVRSEGYGKTFERLKVFKNAQLYLCTGKTCVFLSHINAAIIQRSAWIN